MQRAVTAIYRTADIANLVRSELEQLGIARRNITILPDADGSYAGTGYAATDRTAMDTTGMAYAGTAGMGTTGTAGMGTTGTDYAGSGVDYGSDSIERLHDLGLPDDDLRTYQQAIRNGDYVVSVEVDDEAHLGRVQEIMRRPEDAYDIDELDTRYAAADYVPRQQAAYADTGSMDQMGASTDGTVKVVEEDLAVGKRAVEGGTVRVRSYVREVPVEAAVDLRSTRVYVERRPVDRAVSAGDIPMGDQVLEAREVVEEAVVAKEARVVEEIGLRQETEVEHQTIRDTVRKTEVEIEDTRTGDTQRLTGKDRDRI